MRLSGSIVTGTLAQLLSEAAAARATGDVEREEEALQRALQLQPDDVEAGLLRAENLARKGDRRGATAFYKNALRLAREHGAPPRLVPLLEAAKQYLQESVQHYREWLHQAVTHHRDAGPRFHHSVDMLNGNRSIYLQQPSVLYTPYLPQRQFYEREEFSWAEKFEAKTESIRREVQSLLDAQAPFHPYVEPTSDRPARNFFGLEGNPSWSAFYLYRDGEVVGDNAMRCPETMAALSCVPLSDIGDRTPTVFFSQLRPGAHIPPHHGMLNCRLICHLPLIVPEGCSLRVGNETRHWHEGELLIFDDSIEHEARNDSDQIRIVLIFDIWRPELSRAEQAGISAVFDAIDRFSSLPLD